MKEEDKNKLIKIQILNIEYAIDCIDILANEGEFEDTDDMQEILERWKGRFT